MKYAEYFRIIVVFLIYRLFEHFGVNFLVVYELSSFLSFNIKHRDNDFEVSLKFKSNYRVIKEE